MIRREVLRETSRDDIEKRFLDLVIPRFQKRRKDFSTAGIPICPLSRGYLRAFVPTRVNAPIGATKSGM